MAKWTNTHNLPEPMAAAIRADTYVKHGDISVTALLKPPQMRAVAMRHDSEIEADVATGIYRLLGQSVHTVIERAGKKVKGHLSEKRLSVKVRGWEVTGQADYLGLDDGSLDDFKVTSVYAFLLGEKLEWVAQLNLYRFLFHAHGIKVKKLRIIAILRDWKKSNAKRDPLYPQTACMTVEVEMWPLAKTKAFLEERVRLHQEAEKLADDKQAPCTEQERWARPFTWAVKKPANKTASRVLKSIEEAQDHIAKMLPQDQKQFVIEERPGQNVRCEDYCDAARWCGQFAKIKALSAPEPREAAV